jgi:hypothetical protein
MNPNVELIAAIEETITVLWQGYAIALVIAGLFALTMATIGGLFDND